MFRHILVGLDGSEAAQLAFNRALELASQTGGEVTVLSVEERLPAYAASVGEVEETKREVAEGRLERASRRLEKGRDHWPPRAFPTR